MPSLWPRRAERKCSLVISELFSCDARSCAACSASCIFCVYLSMRILQNTKRDSLGNCTLINELPQSSSEHWTRPLCTKPFDTNAPTTMSVCDERAGKMGWIEVTGAFTSRTIPAVHNRFAYFRQWHMDANDGAKLGDERSHQQGDSAWAGELRRGLAGADTCSGGGLIG